MSRLSRSDIERKALRNAIKVLARRELSADQKVALIQRLISQASDDEVARIVSEKMKEVGNVDLNK